VAGTLAAPPLHGKLDHLGFVLQGVEKSDAGRYCMLYKYGGIYADLDYEASDESLSGYLAAEESAPVASYGVGPASEDNAASAPLPSYEDDQAQYTSFRF